MSRKPTAHGLRAGHLIQFSVRNDTHPGTDHADKQTIANELWDLSNRTTGGCFVYFTSHGSPDGMLMDDGMLTPRALSTMLDNACGSRPTVVFTVACFSGVFVDALEGPNRFVMTAARPDRPSFGCGDNDHYTFFDNCWLDSIGGVGVSEGLATALRREPQNTRSTPSHRPQLSIGAAIAADMPRGISCACLQIIALVFAVLVLAGSTSRRSACGVRMLAKLNAQPAERQYDRQGW